MKVIITVDIDSPTYNFDVERVVHGNLREAIKKSAFYMLEQGLAVSVVGESRIAHGKDSTFIDISRRDTSDQP